MIDFNLKYLVRVRQPTHTRHYSQDIVVDSEDGDGLIAISVSRLSRSTVTQHAFFKDKFRIIYSREIAGTGRLVFQWF